MPTLWAEIFFCSEKGEGRSGRVGGYSETLYGKGAAVVAHARGACIVQLDFGVLAMNPSKPRQDEEALVVAARMQTSKPDEKKTVGTAHSARCVSTSSSSASCNANMKCRGKIE